MKLTYVPEGKFTMGSPLGEQAAVRPLGLPGVGSEGPQHVVEISKPFYMGVYEVTQEQYQKVMQMNPSHFQVGKDGEALVKGIVTKNFPVEMISHEDATDFCRILSQMKEEKASGRVYRLPTEAEWEYACRGGSNPSKTFYYGESLSSTQANIRGDIPWGGAPNGPWLERTCEVGKYLPNAFGLYDMHGNVWEWTSDWYDKEYYDKGLQIDPSGPSAGEYRVGRGGSWNLTAASARSAFRLFHGPGFRGSDRGFRVVAVINPTSTTGVTESNQNISFPATQKADDFVSLFNGKDLAGWKTHRSQPGDWRVDNGILSGSANSVSHLYTDRDDYTDFHLRIEARVGDRGDTSLFSANSGVYARCSFGPTHPANDQQWPAGLNAKIDKRRLGGLILDPDTAPFRRDLEIKPIIGRWLTLEMVARGPRTIIKVDGETTTDFTDSGARFKRGHIALQQHGANTVAEFRKIEIKELVMRPEDQNARPPANANVPWLNFPGGDGPGKGKKIVLVSGDEEYRYLFSAVNSTEATRPDR